MKGGGKVRMDGIGKLISAGLLKAPTATHLDPEYLSAFAENALSAAEREQALEHLSSCHNCREVLFLAQPDTAEQIVVVPARKDTVPLFRWAAVTASIAIVTAGAFFAQRELSQTPQVTARQTPAPAYVNLNDEKSAAMPLSQREAAAPVAAAKQINGRPEPKHMTAKPQTKMQFDSTDQIRISNAAVPAPPQNLPMRGRDETALRDLVATAPAPATHDADKVKANAAPQRTAETVSVSGEAPAVNTEAAALAKEEAYSSQRAMAVGANAGGFVGGLAQPPAAQWSLSRKGELRRSFDQGNNWQKVAVNGTRARFQVVSASGPQVWVGGKSGTLYHSADSGLTWTSVIPIANGQQLTDDIDHIEFTDPQHGMVSAAGAVWTTTDGGQTWSVSKK